MPDEPVGEAEARNLAATGGGPGASTILSVGAIGMAGALAGARYRGPDDEETQERRARRTEAEDRARRDT